VADVVSGVTAPKTLEDALAGLFRYWDQRPDGGSRAELVQAAAAAGFEEPLLNIWLDHFLRGLVTIAVLRAPDYDQDLVPKIAEMGLDAVRSSAVAVFKHLGQAPSTPLGAIRLGAELDVRIAETQQTLDQLATDQAIRDASLTAVIGASFAPEVETLLRRMIDLANRQAAPFLAQIATIMAELIEQRAGL